MRAACAVLGLVLLSLVATSARAQSDADLDVGSEWDAVLMLAPPEGAPDPSTDREKSSAKKSRRRSRGAKPRRASGASYASLSRSWHDAASDAALPTSSEGPLPLVFRAVGDREPCVLTPASDAGGFDDDDIALATRTFGGRDSGPRVHERLLNLIHRAARHFGVPYVHLVSGIRRERQGSRHSHGLAADIVLPGVSDEELAAFFREQGFVGVGIYTRAGFVHIDVRESSYFWIDRSPPGKRWRIQPTRFDEAKAADAAALARGEQPLVNPERLQRALNKRASVRRHKSTKRRASGSPKDERPRREASRTKSSG